MIQTIFNDFGFKASRDFINNLQNIITDYMKLSAYSVGISDLIANVETNIKITETISNKKKEVQDLINETHIGVFENNTVKIIDDIMAIKSTSAILSGNVFYDNKNSFKTILYEFERTEFNKYLMGSACLINKGGKSQNGR